MNKFDYEHFKVLENDRLREAARERLAKEAQQGRNTNRKFQRRSR